MVRKVTRGPHEVVDTGRFAWVMIWQMAEAPDEREPATPVDDGFHDTTSDQRDGSDDRPASGDDAVEPGPGGDGPGDQVEIPTSPATLTDAAIGFLAGLLGSTFLGAITFQFVGDGDTLVITAASLVGLWAGLLWAARRASSRRGSGSVSRDFGLRITPGDIGLGLLGGFGVQSIVALMYMPFSELNSELSAPARSLAEQAPSGASLVVLTTLVVAGAPLVEELFFRGVLLGALRRFGVAVAILVSSVAFALVHFGQLLAMPAFVVLGVVLGIFAVARKRLGAAIVTHATFNAITMAVLLAPTP